MSGTGSTIRQCTSRTSGEIENVTDLPMDYGYQKAFRTAFKATNEGGSGPPDGLPAVSFAPSHFEGGEWNDGENCLQQKSFKSNETVLDGGDMQLYLAEIREFKAVEREGKKKGL